jgi:hypothetical protein
VVHAAQAVLFVPTKKERSASVRAVPGEQAGLAGAVPDSDQVFSHKGQTDRVTVGVGQLLGE